MQILIFQLQKLSLNELVRCADANCCFTPTDVGAHGREGNSSGFSNSSFGKAFGSGDINVPSMRNIPGTSLSVSLYSME